MFQENFESIVIVGNSTTLFIWSGEFLVSIAGCVLCTDCHFCHSAELNHSKVFKIESTAVGMLLQLNGSVFIPGRQMSSGYEIRLPSCDL